MERPQKSATTPESWSGKSAGHGLLGDGGRTSLTIASGDTSVLKRLRRWLDLMIQDGATVDVHLVLSELATNAIQHGTGDEIRIEVAMATDLTIKVINQADRAPEVLDQSVPRPRGRGLAIVAATASVLEIEFGDGVAIVTCSFSGRKSGLTR